MSAWADISATYSLGDLKPHRVRLKMILPSKSKKSRKKGNWAIVCCFSIFRSFGGQRYSVGVLPKVPVIKNITPLAVLLHLQYKHNINFGMSSCKCTKYYLLRWGKKKLEKINFFLLSFIKMKKCWNYCGMKKPHSPSIKICITRQGTVWTMSTKLVSAEVNNTEISPGLPIHALDSWALCFS